MDRFFAEAEVATSSAARLAGVVLEVRLGILVSGIADDLNGALVYRNSDECISPWLRVAVEISFSKLLKLPQPRSPVLKVIAPGDLTLLNVFIPCREW